VERLGVDSLCERLRNLENLEVVGYEGNKAVVQRFKGIVKDRSLVEELGDLSRRRPRGRPSTRLLEVLCSTINELFARRVKFKVVFMGKDVELRLDEGKFIRLGEGEVKVRAPSKDDELIKALLPLLQRLGRVSYLKQLS